MVTLLQKTSSDNYKKENKKIKYRDMVISNVKSPRVQNSGRLLSLWTVSSGTSPGKIIVTSAALMCHSIKSVIPALPLNMDKELSSIKKSPNRHPNSDLNH